MLAAVIIMNIINLVMGHMSCSFFGIGNRCYSMFCKSHFLVKKRGIFKVVYFKPKHFGCFSLFEVVEFLSAYILFVIGTVLIVLFAIGFINEAITGIFVFCSAGFLIFLHVFWTALNDITEYLEGKYFKKCFPELTNNTYLAHVIFYYETNHKKVKSAFAKCIRFCKYYKSMSVERVTEGNLYAIIRISHSKGNDEIKLRY